MDLMINATEEFARIGNAFRRRFLDEADGEGETVGRRFDEAIELGPRKLTLLSPRRGKASCLPGPRRGLRPGCHGATRRD